MLPPRSRTAAQERQAMDREHRIKLLASLGGRLAELGLVEEALEACKTIARLRDGPANEDANPYGRMDDDSPDRSNLTRSAA